MRPYLILRLAGPLQAWGGPTLDRHRPIRPYPGLSALAGLLANAGGWSHREASRLNQLSGAIRYAVREDQAGVVVTDYQTAFLGYEALGRRRPGWTPDGPEGREGSAAKDSHILVKAYIADARFTVALRLEPVSSDLPNEAELANWLRRPARPLFLGRSSCPPGEPLFVGIASAPTAVEALAQHPDPRPSSAKSQRIWYGPGEGPAGLPALLVSDRRDFTSQQHVGTRVWHESLTSPEHC